MAFNEYHQIMKEMGSALTGDADRDIAYLADMSLKYRSHELSAEILRGIGRMMREVLSDDTWEDLETAAGDKLFGWRKALEEADHLVRSGDLNKAVMAIGTLIDRIEASGAFADDSVNEYKDFGETFEEALYLHRSRPERTLRIPKLPYAHIYAKYGFLLYESGETGMAAKALKKAQQWNPVSADISLTLAEVYLDAGDLGSFESITRDSYKNCFRPETLARYYRDLAVCLSGGKKDLSSGEISEILQKHTIPVCPDEDILDLSYAMARELIDMDRLNGAAYFLKIFCDLTDDEGAKLLLDMIRQEIDR